MPNSKSPVGDAALIAELRHLFDKVAEAHEGDYPDKVGRALIAVYGLGRRKAKAEDRRYEKADKLLGDALEILDKFLAIARGEDEADDPELVCEMVNGFLKRVAYLRANQNRRLAGYMGDINGPGCDPDTR